MNKVAYILLNFAAPLVFFFSFQFYGAKPAIGLAITCSLIQLMVHHMRRIRPSAFFLVSLGFTLFFGIADLSVRSPHFFRLEPFVQNFAIASALLVSVIMGVPLLNWFVHAVPLPFRPVVSDEYLRGLTLMWMIYFYAKAFFFLYLASKLDLGTLILVRSFVGGGSFFLLAGGEFIYRKYFRKTPHSSQSGSIQPFGAHP